MNSLQQTHKKLFTKVVGLYYTKSEQLVAMFPSNTRLRILPDPTNVYDSHAVGVYYAGKQLGYIPRDQTHVVHTFLKKGFTVFGVSGTFHPKIATPDLTFIPSWLDLVIFFKKKL